MNGPMMALFSGMNKKSDKAGFLAVYPNGTGKFDLFLVTDSLMPVSAPNMPRLLDDPCLCQRGFSPRLAIRGSIKPGLADEYPSAWWW